LIVRLALNVGYWGMRGPGTDDLEIVLAAERLGFSVVWAAEAYGSDAVTVLSWLAAKTSTIDLGSAVLQIPARTPTMTAMTAATLDTLSEGRFRLGLGVSGPQVSEGWHGVRFAKPLARTREYVDIVNLALSRHRVRYDGATYQLPLPDGPGKALHLMLHPVRDHIPIYLAAVGPRNLELAGEIADGWQPVFFSPDHAGEHLDRVRAGRAKVGKDLTGFDISATVPMVVGDDLEACAAPIRPYSALYIGGMGSRDQNFYNALAVRMGYEEAAATVQDLYLARDYDGAAAAVPFEFVDGTSLLGPVERIAERMQAFAGAGVTTMSISPYGDTHDERIAVLRAAAQALEKSGVGS
jgi:F420-dependent oxidoreductase-like protein